MLPYPRKSAQRYELNLKFTITYNKKASFSTDLSFGIVPNYLTLLDRFVEWLDDGKL